MDLEMFGQSVSLDDNRLAVGAPYGDGSGNSNSNSGEVYLYTFSDSTFSGGELAATIGNGYSGGNNIDQTLGGSDYFGWSVSLDGTQMAVGAYAGDVSGNSVGGSGEVYLYTFSNSTFLSLIHL